jgi:transcriptional regulator GlxA family with amidase domain
MACTIRQRRIRTVVPVVHSSVMISAVIPAFTGTASIGTAGLMDALNKADASWAMTGVDNATRLFDVRLVGLNSAPVVCKDGVRLHPAATADQIAIPDLVVIPGLDDDLWTSLDLNRRWVPWITRWHTEGARVAVSCTGAFLAAEAGVLAGRPATTHWMFADELQRRYPSTEVRADRMLIDTGDVITSGGATAFLTLVVYLIERFGGHERANLAAKMLLIDGHRPSQLPYVAGLPSRSHDDPVVHEIQAHIDAHLDEPLRLAKLASQFGLSSRTLTRRFMAATGNPPLNYLVAARIQEAKRLLETTTEPIDAIRRRVGYQDASAFRRAFKLSTGLSPNDYRRAYGPKRG